MTITMIISITETIAITITIQYYYCSKKGRCCEVWALLFNAFLYDKSLGIGVSGLGVGLGLYEEDA